jgi:benzoate transport
MKPMQAVIVAICILLNAIDGFDVLSISFAAPGIAEAWGINRATLGVVLSMELIGMAVGSIMLGNLADKIGRRPVTLGCLIIMTSGMYVASLANDITGLSATRFFTGIGIGGLLASVNSIAAEFSNLKRRPLCLALLGAGFPLGGIFGGMVASHLLHTFDWRAVFQFGSLMTALFIPVVFFLVPETIGFTAKKRPDNALEKINKTLLKIGHQPLTHWPEQGKAAAKTGLKELFSPAFAMITTLLTFAYFMHVLTYYYLLKWTPKIIADMGFSSSSAGGVLVWVSVGGVTGALIYGVLTQFLDRRLLLLATLCCATIAVALFGHSPESLDTLSILAAGAGFFCNAAMVGLFTMFVFYFPAQIRAGGTGFVIGVGRGGAALSPIIAGLLFTADLSFSSVSAILGTGSIIAAITLWFLSNEQTKKELRASATKVL